MISKLPRWIEYGALLLAALAGCVNVIALMSFQHQAISHLSGTMSLLGSSLITPSESSLHLLFIVISFMLGSTFSGFFIGNSALKLGRRYGVALCIEGGLLLISLAVLIHGFDWGQYFASAACGLQNAMITTYSGAVIRTTHMTGIITDLGIMLGESLKGRKFDRRKAKLFIFIILGFVSGGGIGAWLYLQLNLFALSFPACLAFCIAFSYWLYLHNKSRIQKP